MLLSIREAACHVTSSASGSIVPPISMAPLQACCITLPGPSLADPWAITRWQRKTATQHNCPEAMSAVSPATSDPLLPCPAVVPHSLLGPEAQATLPGPRSAIPCSQHKPHPVWAGKPTRTAAPAHSHGMAPCCPASCWRSSMQPSTCTCSSRKAVDPTTMHMVC
jgi:hypothetical protein